MSTSSSSTRLAKAPPEDLWATWKFQHPDRTATVCICGIGRTLEEARQAALKALHDDDPFIIEGDYAELVSRDRDDDEDEEAFRTWKKETIEYVKNEKPNSESRMAYRGFITTALDG